MLVRSIAQSGSSSVSVTDSRRAGRLGRVALCRPCCRIDLPGYCDVSILPALQARRYSYLPAAL